MSRGCWLCALLSFTPCCLSKLTPAPRALGPLPPPGKDKEGHRDRGRHGGRDRVLEGIESQVGWRASDPESCDEPYSPRPRKKARRCQDQDIREEKTQSHTETQSTKSKTAETDQRSRCGSLASSVSFPPFLPPSLPQFPALALPPPPPHTQGWMELSLFLAAAGCACVCTHACATVCMLF